MIEEAGDVVDAIRQAIVDGDYAPRRRLVEAEMCERFGVSRFTLRKALQELASEGLVELQPNRGASVREVSFAEAIEITEVRQLLEGLEARRAASQATVEDVAALRLIIADMRGAVRQADSLGYSELNLQLHATIRRISGHETAARLLSQLKHQTSRHHFSLSQVPGRPTVSLPQHEAIVEAIATHDGAAAEAAMHAHLQSVIDAFRSFAKPERRP